jgi:hypothetical protein
MAVKLVPTAIAPNARRDKSFERSSYSTMSSIESLSHISLIPL